jgi:aminoglycoside phosphotransferase family enzyme/predicted kinase
MIRAMQAPDPAPPEIRIPVEALIEGLSAPGALGALGRVEEVRQTHLSIVFLTPTHAIKCKKPARFWGLVDQAGFARRERACRLEVELNRRLAPSLYLGVEPVVRRGGRLALGGVGAVLEHAVLMRRLPRGATFAEQLRDGTLDGPRIEEAAARLARFHDAHPLDPAPAGTAEAFLAVLAGNFEGTPIEAGGLFPATLHVAIRNAMNAGARRLLPLMQARAAAGRYVDGHGDVRLDHVAVLDEQIIVLDCVEFSETLRHVDRLSDAAFLDMDLRSKGHPKFADQFRAAYLEAAGESEARTEALSACFRAYRAYVRATVDVHTAADAGIPQALRDDKSDAAQHYLALAATESGALPKPMLVLLRGTSGTGKSVLASRLAPLLRAQILRSDVVRKQLLGLAPTERPTGGETAVVYGKEMSLRTYAELRTRAEQHLVAGRTVLLDATWLVAAARAEARALAARLGVPFAIIDLSCETQEIERRLRERAARNDDASDAGVEVFREQLRTSEPLTEAEQRHAIPHVSGERTGRLLMSLLTLALEGATA